MGTKKREGKTVMFWLDEDTHKKLKVLTAQNGTTISDVMKEAVTKYLKQGKR